jgi:CRISPR system Cascade subunit CasA
MTNLIIDPWLPVVRMSGRREVIAPNHLTSSYTDDPVVAVAWPRPDFDLATHELLIGLLAATYPLNADGAGWVDAFHNPPAPAELAERLAPLAPYFNIDGAGPLFMQDHDGGLEGEALPMDRLLIDGTGENTEKLNKDLFTKRRPGAVLSRPAAAIAAYALQQWASKGGPGQRVGLRGGGPLVTLALPDGGRPARLWEVLWLNTPSDRRLADPARAFPWLAPCLTSKRHETLHETDADRLQAFFGTPRRMRLVWAENIDRRPCMLTGVVDDVVCTGFIRVQHGVNYGVWRHPLTPYRVNNGDV